MKKFLRAVIIFIAPVILAFVVVEIAIRDIPNDYSYKKEYLDKNAKDIELLILGNSHTYYGIDPEWLKERSFNLAHISQKPEYDLVLLQKYKDHWNKLKCIVVPVDYFSLLGKMNEGQEKWRVKNYNIYYDIHTSWYPADNLEILNGRLMTNLYRLKHHYLDGRSSITCNQYGWGKKYVSSKSKDLEKTGIVAAERHTISDHSHFQENVGFINEIITFANTRNIKVVFITSPAYQSYRAHLDPHQLDETVSTMENIVRKHSDARYYNLLDNPTFLAEDFYDADHLNEKGAKKLSQVVDSLIRL